MAQLIFVKLFFLSMIFMFSLFTAWLHLTIGGNIQSERLNYCHLKS